MSSYLLQWFLFFFLAQTPVWSKINQRFNISNDGWRLVWVCVWMCVCVKQQVIHPCDFSLVVSHPSLGSSSRWPFSSSLAIVLAVIFILFHFLLLPVWCGLVYLVLITTCCEAAPSKSSWFFYHTPLTIGRYLVFCLRK